MGWTIGILGFGSRRRLGIFLFTTASRTALVHPDPYPMGTRGSFHGNKGAGRKADHSPPSSAEVKEWVELYFHSPNTPPWRGAELKKVRGQLYLLPPYLEAVSSIRNPSMRHGVPVEETCKCDRDQRLDSSTELRMVKWSGIRVLTGDWEFISSPPRPDRLWGPSSLLSNGYWGPFLWG
jgi:hypothetical protein